MKKIKRAVLTLIAAILVSSMTVPAFAADDLRDVFQNAMYGGLTGGLVGAALLMFTHKPGDHLDYIGVGAATGVLLGGAYGVAKSSRAFAEIEDGKVRLAVPTIIPQRTDGLTKGASTVMLKAELLKGTF